LGFHSAEVVLSDFQFYPLLNALTNIYKFNTIVFEIEVLTYVCAFNEKPRRFYEKEEWGRCCNNGGVIGY
jgi:hypothetical protein